MFKNWSRKCDDSPNSEMRCHTHPYSIVQFLLLLALLRNSDWTFKHLIIIFSHKVVLYDLLPINSYIFGPLIYGQDWWMEFNKDKCKTIHYGHGNQCIRYNIDETILNSTVKEKDLGVIMSSDLKPSAQCVAAANNRIRSDYFQICPKKFFFTFL